MTSREGIINETFEEDEEGEEEGEFDETNVVVNNNNNIDKDPMKSPETEIARLSFIDSSQMVEIPLVVESGSADATSSTGNRRRHSEVTRRYSPGRDLEVVVVLDEDGHIRIRPETLPRPVEIPVMDTDLDICEVCESSLAMR